MGTVFAAASALVVAAVGAAAALSAPFGAAGNGGQYLAGHVLLGLGLGQSIALMLRTAAKRLVVTRSVARRLGSDVVRAAPGQDASVSAARRQPGAAAPAAARPATLVSAHAARAATAPVTLLPAPSAALTPLRGRHAA
ncbi:Flagellar hook-associated protein flgK [Arthrobacter sp. 9AX]|uniref:hypothetical protein n=1 Tax=Arthrobacter sp. 9AX TaxID=2653131 RepID=UPI0012F1F7B9|nr:hypothetical protein [Arthrobacter sp. 9AX]VXB27330.1 Flagellar hook-associated protein flgK [Arthrobacter sp. 9AX]